MPGAKLRLDRLLVELGLVGDARTATGLIMAGRVVCDGSVVSKPGQLVAPDVVVHVRGERLKYASRGGYKLERALARFGVDPAGRVALDAGASTGGFTDCLLQAGAARVYAVDVGYGQLRGALARDPRVEVREKTNIAELSAASFAEPIDLIVVDLSYLSLLKAIPLLASCMLRPLRMIALIKPLYEGLRREQMDDRGALSGVLTGFFEALARSPFAARDACVSPILGGSGAIEFLTLIEQPAARAPAELVARALESWRECPPLPPERATEL